METKFLRWLLFQRASLSPLAGDINWMETGLGVSTSYHGGPHSLGTLIEWKLISLISMFRQLLLSPLAGDINWMETRRCHPLRIPLSCPESPLAGDINWMETSCHRFLPICPVLRPHSLGTLIEWKHVKNKIPRMNKSSPHSLGTLIEWKLLNST